MRILVLGAVLALGSFTAARTIGQSKAPPPPTDQAAQRAVDHKEFQAALAKLEAQSAEISDRAYCRTHCTGDCASDPKAKSCGAKGKCYCSKPAPKKAVKHGKLKK